MQKRIQRAVLVSSARTVLFQKTHEPEDADPPGEDGAEGEGEVGGEARDQAAEAAEQRAWDAERRGRKKDD